MGFADREEMCDNDIPEWLRTAALASEIPNNLNQQSQFETYLSYIRRYTCLILNPKCGYTTACGTAGIGIESVAEAKLAYDSDYHSPEKYYPGIALMISGPMHITSKKDKAFEETGLFEMALNFESSVAAADAISEPINR